MTTASGGECPMAAEMFSEACTTGQSARRIVDEAQAASVRKALRGLGRASDVRLRTARIDEVVVVARIDAALWSDDAVTMRRKLTPPDT